MIAPPVVQETVMVPAALAAAISRFSVAEVYSIAGEGSPRCRPILARSEWHGDVLYVHLGDVLDVSDASTPIQCELFDDDWGDDG